MSLKEGEKTSEPLRVVTKTIPGDGKNREKPRQSRARKLATNTPTVRAVQEKATGPRGPKQNYAKESNASRDNVDRHRDAEEENSREAAVSITEDEKHLRTAQGGNEDQPWRRQKPRKPSTITSKKIGHNYADGEGLQEKATGPMD